MTLILKLKSELKPKPMKTYIIVIALQQHFLAATPKEKAHLQLKVDSLNKRAVESKKVELAMNEVVSSLIPSI